MPLASDTSTGGRKAAVDRDIIAAAAAGGRTLPPRPEPSVIASQGDHLRSPEHPSNVTGHSNPAMVNPFGPSREALVNRAIVDDLAMKTGALTTVPGVSDYEFKMPTQADAYADALEVARGEARERGLNGTAIDVYAGQRAPQLMEDIGDGTAAGPGRLAKPLSGDGKLGAQLRAVRNGVESGGDLGDTKAMSSKAFAALSPRQKAAVELNSMLVEAARRDAGEKQKGNPGGEKYDAAVESLFPGEGKDAPYAPNTVDVLANIGWKSTGTDLEDILSGKLGFTRQDIADLGPEREGAAPDASLNTGAHLRDVLQESLVKAFTAQRKEAVPGENLLAAKQDLLGYDKMPAFADGGREVVPGVKLGDFMRSGFDLLANSNSGFTPEQILADAKQNLTDEEFTSFLNFIDINSRDAKNYRQPLGSSQGTTYFDPVEFRQSIAKTLRKER